jgi:hypothetical protein
VDFCSDERISDGMKPIQNADRADYEAYRRRHPETIAALEMLIEKMISREIGDHSTEKRRCIARGMRLSADDNAMPPQDVSVGMMVRGWLVRGRLQ